MIKFRVEVKSYVGDAIRASERATDDMLVRAGHLMRFAGQALTRANPRNPRPAGKAWRRGSGWLRDRLSFDVDHGQQEAVLGFGVAQKVGDLHEFGGTARHKKTGRMLAFPARPVLQLAREKAIEKGRRKWPEEWARVFGK